MSPLIKCGDTADYSSGRACHSTVACWQQHSNIKGYNNLTTERSLVQLSTSTICCQAHPGFQCQQGPAKTIAL
jgi:hypothetical protein